MVVLSPERMKSYDAYAIDTFGIPSAVLMENAGRSTYRLMREAYLAQGARLVVVCGRGNNGGDGFVIARYARRDGFDTRVLLVADGQSIKGDARLNMDLYRALGGPMTLVGQDPSGVGAALRESDVIVDALFGTGLAKEVAGVERLVIGEINRAGKPVIAVDIPSGLDGRSGVPLGDAVRATHTYTYGHPKLGQLLYPGAACRGRLTVIDISLPGACEDSLGFDARLVDGAMVRSFFRERPPDSHKGMFGDLAVVAGSVGKTGAAAMASMAALRIGAGLVTLVIPASLNPIVASKLTEAMTYSVEDGGKGVFLLSSERAVREFASEKDVVILGPGLGREEETMAFARKLFEEVERPFVIDADGINAFAGHLGLLKEQKGKVILTPHPGEFGRLIGQSALEVNRDRLDAGRRFAEEHKVNLVLKGAPTITFSPEGEAFINPTGNPALAKGGTGDILTGFIGGLASQGYTLTQAGVFGAYIHGYIADTWAGERSDMDMVAGDLISGVGAAIRDIRHGTDRVYIEKSL